MAGQLANGVGDGDVGAASRGLLGGGNLEDTVDVDLEDDLEDGLTSLHGRNRSQGKFTQGSVVLAVDTLTLEDGELNGLLVVGNGGEGPIDSLELVTLRKKKEKKRKKENNSRQGKDD
jgi:hypothetical protein